MALRDIVIWPDPVLTREARAVEPSEFGEDFDRLIEDMIETMIEADGLGLAAPQIGLSRRIFVLDVPLGVLEEPEPEPEPEPADEAAATEGADLAEPPPRTGPLVFVNPEFVEMEGEILFEEGCLSLPGLTVEMKRAPKVTVRALDQKGEFFEIVAEDLFAIALQHENDHLTGHLLVEKLSPLKRKLFRKKMEKLKEEETED